MDKQVLKLKNKLQFWYQDRPTKENYQQSLLPVGLVDSVETFWAFYQHFKRPSQLADNSTIFLFKQSIKPIWEDAGNQNGGSFILKFEHQKSDKVCQDIILAFVAKNLEEDNQINGLRIKIKKDATIIEIWIPQVSDEDNVEGARDWIIKSTCLNQDTQFQLMKFRMQ